MYDGIGLLGNVDSHDRCSIFIQWNLSIDPEMIFQHAPAKDTETLCEIPTFSVHGLKSNVDTTETGPNR